LPYAGCLHCFKLAVMQNGGHPHGGFLQSEI
jgi:hypothetical protein